MLKRFTWVFIFLFLILGTFEVVLRYNYGFLDTPLYISDPDFEYIYAPNQNVLRFGNVIKTNEYSLRSDPILPSDTTVILLIGDSVVLGGSLTDQDSLASTLLEKRLSRTLDRRVRVLNIAAGSWGPDNAAAFLTKNGMFNADLMCLVASSHDAYDNMNHADVVGKDINFPDKQYRFALEELWVRYLYPRYFRDMLNNQTSLAPKVDHEQKGIHKTGIEFNPGFQQLKTMAHNAGIPFIILLHPEISEVSFGNYNSQGKDIIRFAENNSVLLLKELDWGLTKKYYRKDDVVHYSSEGQVFLANKLYPIFLNYIKPEKAL